MSSGSSSSSVPPSTSSAWSISRPGRPRDYGPPPHADAPRPAGRAPLHITGAVRGPTPFLRSAFFRKIPASEYGFDSAAERGISDTFVRELLNDGRAKRWSVTCHPFRLLRQLRLGMIPALHHNEVNGIRKRFSTSRRSEDACQRGDAHWGLTTCLT